MPVIPGPVRTLFGHIGADLLGRLNTFLLIIGIAGTGIAAYSLGSQVVASFSYQPATATIVRAQWECRTPLHQGACSEDEAKIARQSGGSGEFRVTFRFTDAGGKVHTLTTYIPKTGMLREDAKPGVTFALLYDPDDPTRTALPLGSDMNTTLIGLAGIAALAFYIAIARPFGWFSRRAKKG